ncbi:hypothetical protein F8388_027172 [Cannabis sativa]|uniref:Cysteine-rich PDZ-binding protein n=1 Tax=Cannabis sativa TaxID=3483 RepID=A0A7J6FRT0_CANSA|nr:hypothetical protein F8388_027172 [Cannabis sativa]
MVCDKCEKKLAKVIVPDKWKEGASNTTEGGGRKINENKLLSKKKRLFLVEVVELDLKGFLGFIPGGVLTEIPSALYASNKYTRMVNTATHVLTAKGFVPCAVNKCLTQSCTNRAMHNSNQMWAGSHYLIHPVKLHDLVVFVSLVLVYKHENLLCLIEIQL